MALSNKLKNLRMKAGLKQKDLADKLHVSQQAVAKWENGKSEPNISMLKDIAGALNCTIEYLIDENNDTKLDIESVIAVREVHDPVMINFENMCSELDEDTLDRVHCVLGSLRRLQNNPILLASDKQYIFSCIAEIVGRIELYIDNFRSLPKNNSNVDLFEHNKRFINAEIEVIRELINIVIHKKEYPKEQKCVLPFYITPVSASTGSFVFDDAPTEWMTISKTDNSKEADFILEVRGDSMNPKFFDGNKVLIKRAESISEGKIGVFIVDGESYIKQMGKNELISLNPNFRNIPLREYNDCRCVGEVIGVLVK